MKLFLDFLIQREKITVLDCTGCPKSTWQISWATKKYVNIFKKSNILSSDDDLHASQQNISLAENAHKHIEQVWLNTTQAKINIGAPGFAVLLKALEKTLNAALPQAKNTFGKLFPHISRENMRKTTPRDGRFVFRWSSSQNRHTKNGLYQMISNKLDEPRMQEDELLKSGLIYPSLSPRRTRVFFLTKVDETLRMYLYYWKLNKDKSRRYPTHLKNS